MMQDGACRSCYDCINHYSEIDDDEECWDYCGLDDMTVIVSSSGKVYLEAYSVVCPYFESKTKRLVE